MRGRRAAPANRGTTGRSDPEDSPDGGTRPGTASPPDAAGPAAEEQVPNEQSSAQEGSPDAGLIGIAVVESARAESFLATAAIAHAASPQTGKARDVTVRTGPLAFDGRPVVTAEVQDVERGRALSVEAAAALAGAAGLALERRLPLVAWLSSPGLDLSGGVAVLDGWGRVARAFARCSGVVPLVAVLDGPVLSGPRSCSGWPTRW